MAAGVYSDLDCRVSDMAIHSKVVAGAATKADEMSQVFGVGGVCGPTGVMISDTET